MLKQTQILPAGPYFASRMSSLASRKSKDKHHYLESGSNLMIQFHPNPETQVP
jgi:hypothetical protein